MFHSYFIRKIFNVIKKHSIIAITTLLFFLIITISSYLTFLSSYSISLFKHIEQQINLFENIENVGISHHYIHTIKVNDMTVYKQSNIENTLELNSNIVIKFDSIDFFFPSMLSKKVKIADDEIEIIISITEINHILLELLTIISFMVFLIVISILTLFSKEVKNNENLRYVADEYALSERTLNYIISIMNHKLNTPLKILRTKLRLISEHMMVNSEIGESDGGEKILNYLASMGESLNNIQSINKQLTLYQTQSNRLENMHDVISLSLNTLQVLTDIDFDTLLDYRFKLYKFTYGKIHNTELVQLFTNQIKFSLDNIASTIEIQIIKFDNNMLELEIKDDGNAINEVLVDKVNMNADTNAELNHSELDVSLNMRLITNVQGRFKIISAKDGKNVIKISIPAQKITN